MRLGIGIRHDVVLWRLFSPVAPLGLGCWSFYCVSIHLSPRWGLSHSLRCVSVGAGLVPAQKPLDNNYKSGQPQGLPLHSVNFRLTFNRDSFIIIVAGDKIRGHPCDCRAAVRAILYPWLFFISAARRLAHHIDQFTKPQRGGRCIVHRYTNALKPQRGDRCIISRTYPPNQKRILDYTEHQNAPETQNTPP